jgi:sodium transport system permease protein
VTVWVVATKELRELFRDARSVAMSVVVPLILFPALFLVLESPVRAQRERSLEQIVVGTVGVPDHLPEDVQARRVDGPGALQAANPAVHLVAGPDRVVWFNPRSETSVNAAAVLRAWWDSARTDPEVASVRFQPVADGPGLLALASGLPLLLFLASLVSLLPAALDLGAGEKERQTLEPLLIATGHHGAVFAGKLIATVVTGGVGVIAFLCGVTTAVVLAPGVLGQAPSWPVQAPGQAFLVSITVVVLVVLLGAVELTVSLLARSPREAQGLFLPLLLIVSGAAYRAILTDLWFVPAGLWFVPLLNLGLLLKGVLLQAPVGAGSGGTMVLVLVENVVLSWVFITLGRRILASEWVLRRH